MLFLVMAINVIILSFQENSQLMFVIDIQTLCNILIGD